MNPIVSVIISAYNCDAYVADAIQSIIDQSYKDWEILISDDGSTDYTKAIIDSFDDPRICRFHNERNFGLLKTWNDLLGQVKGELITWQDADDISYPSRLEKLVTAFKRDPNLMLCGSNSIRYYRFWKRAVQTNFPTEHSQIIKIIQEERTVPFTGATKMIRREVLAHIEGFRHFFDRLGFEDHDFILRVAEKYKVANLPEILYEYRYVNGSASRNFSTEFYLRPSINQVGFFLADQRSRDHGLDGFMPNGNKEELEQYIIELKQQFDQDPSIIYRRNCKNKIYNYDFLGAIHEAILAILLKPTVFQNYILLPKIVKNFLRAVLHLIITPGEKMTMTKDEL